MRTQPLEVMVDIDLVSIVLRFLGTVVSYNAVHSSHSAPLRPVPKSHFTPPHTTRYLLRLTAGRPRGVRSGRHEYHTAAAVLGY